MAENVRPVTREGLKAAVQSMIDAGESPENIQILINSAQVTPDAPKTPPTFWQEHPNIAATARGVTGALPGIGALAGGVLASPGLVTTPLGVGLGAGVGRGAQDLINEATGLTETTSPQSKAGRIGLDTALGAAGTAVLPGAVEAARTPIRTVGELGTSLPPRMAKAMRDWLAPRGGGFKLPPKTPSPILTRPPAVTAPAATVPPLAPAPPYRDPGWALSRPTPMQGSGTPIVTKGTAARAPAPAAAEEVDLTSMLGSGRPAPRQAGATSMSGRPLMAEAGGPIGGGPPAVAPAPALRPPMAPQEIDLTQYLGPAARRPLQTTTLGGRNLVSETGGPPTMAPMEAQIAKTLPKPPAGPRLPPATTRSGRPFLSEGGPPTLSPMEQQMLSSPTGEVDLTAAMNQLRSVRSNILPSSRIRASIPTAQRMSTDRQVAHYTKLIEEGMDPAQAAQQVKAAAAIRQQGYRTSAGLDKGAKIASELDY